MTASEMQKRSAHREYRQLMFRQFLMWLFGVSVPALLLISLFR